MSNYSKNIYDIDVKFIFRSLQYLFENDSDLKDDLDKVEYLSIFKQHSMVQIGEPVSSLGLYDNAVAENLLNEDTPLIIKPSLKGCFNYFIYQQLIITDVDQIKTILTRHLNQYEGSKEDFIRMTGTFTRSSLKINTPRISEEKRLDKLSEWAVDRLIDFEKDIDNEEDLEKQEEIVKLFKKPDDFFTTISSLNNIGTLRDDGSFKGVTPALSEINIVIEYLDLKGLLKQNDFSVISATFCSYFQIELKKRSLTHIPVDQEAHKLYRNLFT